MLRQTNPIWKYPNKSVLEDVISRSGEADVNNTEHFTPFGGLSEIIEMQFSGKQAHRFSMSTFVQYILSNSKGGSGYTDFDPKRISGNTGGMLRESLNNKGAYVTLEDIMDNGQEIEVTSWLKNMCVGYKTNAESPYVKGLEHYTTTVYNDEGDAEEEKMLEVRLDEGLSNEEFEDIVRELPYVIKSIWSYSKQYQANLFSFIYAYVKILNSGKTKNVTVTDFRDKDTYLLKKNGEYVRKFVHDADNKYVIYPNVIKIFTEPREHIDIYNLCMKFIGMLNRLGINIEDEDPTKYNNDFINSLICTYLPSNTEYFDRYKDIDVEIIVALKADNVFSTTKSNLYSNTFSKSGSFNYEAWAELATDQITIAYRCGEIDDDFLKENEEESINLLLNILAVNGGTVNSTALESLVTYGANGLMYFNNEIFTVSGKYFGMLNNSYDYMVSLTKFGFVIILEEEYDTVKYISIKDCLKALEVYRTYGNVQSEANWKRIGDDY